MKTFFLARLGKDAEQVKIAEKDAVKFNVAVDEWNGKERVARWITCVDYHGLNVLQYLKKGTQVVIIGDLKAPRVYQTSSGATNISEDCVVNSLQLVGGASQTQPQAETAQPTEDLPF